MNIDGHAVADASGAILIPTISDTHRGAMVKYLGIYCRIGVSAMASDRYVKQTFNTEAILRDAGLVAVEVRIVK